VRIRTLRPEQHTKWMDVLEQSFQHDFYHLPSYHALAEERGEGEAHLFLYEEGDCFIAVPLLLRSMESVPCHAHSGEGRWDATSVYGYAGPIASRRDMPASILRSFQAALRETLLERHIVTVFSRLHPLIPQWGLLAGLGDCMRMGLTVSIDLTLPTELQRARYRKNHKRDINKLHRLGVACVRDQHRKYMSEFIDIYYETMYRTGASEAYFFEPRYFEQLMAALGSGIQLFVCLLGEKVLCAGLFTLSDGIVQYHLGGTRDDFLNFSPMKMLFDTVRLWANERGARMFHLGGGVGSQEDSLLHFKAGFSDRRHEFVVWRWLLLPDIDRQLRKEKERWRGQCNPSFTDSRYFPAYRCPDCPYITQ